MYIGDLHIHSRYSRATSRDCTPEYLDLWARKKGIDIVGTILFVPTVIATGTKLHICTIGIPDFSISFTIVAPQRVQVPQVETIIHASTPAS